MSFRVVVRAVEDGGYTFQIFTLGAEPRPARNDNQIYATRQEAERAGFEAVEMLRAQGPPYEG